MGGGGGSTSSSTPNLPPELARLYSGVATQLNNVYGAAPFTDFLGMDPRQIAGEDPAQRAAYNAVSGFAGSPLASNRAFDAANALSAFMPGGGGGFSIGGGAQNRNSPQATASAASKQAFNREVGDGGEVGGGGFRGGGGGGGGGATEQPVETAGPPGQQQPQTGINNPDADTSQFGQFQDTAGTGAAGPQGGYNVGTAADYGVDFADPSKGPAVAREGNPLDTIDFANHPALRSAMKSFEAATMPGIANQMAAQGLGRSGAALSSVAGAKAQMALPVMQQLMGLEMQNKGLDVSQRGQDLSQLIQQGGLGLQARGQDIGSILQARGQDIGAAQASMGGFAGLGQQDLGRLGQYIGGLESAGAGARGREQEGYNAAYDAQQQDRQAALQALLAPLGGINAAIGTTTQTSGGK